jgi:hypothetical protein
MSRLLFVLAVADGNAVLAVGAFLLLRPGAAGSTSPELRPDLVRRMPTKVSVRGAAARFALGFDAAVENHGAGPLLVNGHRAPTGPEMVADQLVRRRDGSSARVAGVGRIRYTGGHDHWHLLRAVRYELRRASDHALGRPDQKTGFCLGDRYDTGRSLPRKPSRAVLNVNCRLYEPMPAP